MSNSTVNLLTPLTLLWNLEWESDKIKYELFEIHKHNDNNDDYKDNPDPENSGDETNSEAMTIVTISHSQLDSQVFQSCIQQRNIEIEEVKQILLPILHQIQLWWTIVSKMMMNSEIIQIRDFIPLYRICAVELSLNKISKKKHDSAHQQHLYQLSQSGAEDAAEESMSHLNSQKHC